MFGGGLPALLRLGNGESRSIASQPNRLSSDTGDMGGKAQATLSLGCLLPNRELAVWLLEGRLGFVAVAKWQLPKRSRNAAERLDVSSELPETFLFRDSGSCPSHAHTKNVRTICLWLICFLFRICY